VGNRSSIKRMHSSVLVLWSAQGAVGSWYAEDSGPIAIWQAWSDDVVQGHALSAGHFFPEEIPDQTADALNRFFGGC
jgi:haloacetate dehalogenase